MRQSWGHGANLFGPACLPKFKQFPRECLYDPACLPSRTSFAADRPHRARRAHPRSCGAQRHDLQGSAAPSSDHICPCPASANPRARPAQSKALRCCVAARPRANSDAHLGRNVSGVSKPVSRTGTVPPPPQATRTVSPSTTRAMRQPACSKAVGAPGGGAAGVQAASSADVSRARYFTPRTCWRQIPAVPRQSNAGRILPPSGAPTRRICSRS